MALNILNGPNMAVKASSLGPGVVLQAARHGLLVGCGLGVLSWFPVVYVRVEFCDVGFGCRRAPKPSQV